MKQNAAVEVRERLQKKAAIFQQIFSTPAGKEGLEYLDEEFTRGQMFTADPLQTAYMLGARDVVIYLQQLIKYGDK